MKIKTLALTALLAFSALSVPAEAGSRRDAAIAGAILGGIAIGLGAYAYDDYYVDVPVRRVPAPVYREYYYGGNNYYYGGTYCCGAGYRTYRRHHHHHHD